MSTIGNILRIGTEPLAAIRKVMVPKHGEIGPYGTLVLPIPRLEESRIRLGSFAILVGGKSVLTIHDGHASELVKEVERSFQKTEAWEHSVSVLVVRLLREIVDNTDEILESLRETIEKMEIEAMVKASQDLLRKVMSLKRLLSTTHRLLIAEKDVLASVKGNIVPHLKMDGQVLTFMNDIYGDVDRQLASIDSNSSRVSDSLHMHSIALTAGLSRIMTYLTVIATALLLPNTIATFFGVPYLPWESDSPFFGFIQPWQLIVVALLASTVVPLIWMMKKGWLKV